MPATVETALPSLAAEPTGTYDTAPAAPPLDLPPALRELLDLASTADRVIARMITLLVRLQTSGQVETDTGLPIETWLAQLGRMMRIDRTFLTTAADVLATMPATLACFAAGTLSWSQIRAIVTSVRPLRTAARAALDDEIAAAAREFATWDPDQIVWRVELLAADACEQADRDDPDDLLDPADRPADTLILQPRLDGTGGKLYGDYHDPVSFGILENALSEQMGRPDSLEPTVDDASRRRNADRIGQARADALVSLCARSLAGDDTKPAKPLVLATTTLESLLGMTHTPGDLLTRMTGGRLRVDAPTLRRLIDDGGAALRTIVLDDTGRALGVGRKTYVPPGWLRETVLALDRTCAAPGCRQPARLCDLDHIQPWPEGRTDVDNIQPACRPDHNDKTDGRWHVTVLPDGTRRWTHTRTGLTTDTPLATRPLATPAPQPPPSPERSDVALGDGQGSEATRRHP